MSEQFDRLCRAGEISGPVDALAVEQAAAELCVRFPSEYSDFLRTYGAVLADGISIYGLPKDGINDPPLWQDVVSVTKQLREWGQIGSDRPGFLAISEDGFGNYVYLDTSVSPKTRICIVGSGVDRAFDISLFEFFVGISSGSIAT